MKKVRCEYDRWVVETHLCNFASCVIRQTRSLGALTLCSICNSNIRADDKRGYTPPQNIDKRGTPICVDGEVFDVHVVVGITPTAQQDVCASTVHYSSYIHHHCIRTAGRPTACGTSVQALSSPESQTSWYPVRAGNISAHRERVNSSKTSLII